MQKKLITLAVAAALAAPLAAQADATMYGRMNMSYDIVDVNVNGAGDWGFADIASDSSKIGVKGSEDLGNGLKAIYQMEWTVNLADEESRAGGNEFNANASALSARNIFVGLAGDWGTAIIGRHDTPLKISTAKLDYFADSIADADAAGNHGWTAGLNDRRADQTVAYISPNWNGLTLAGALVPGANNSADGVADAYSFAAMYGNSGFYGSLAYEGGDQDIEALGGPGTLTFGDLEQWRVGLGYEAEAFKVGFVYENTNVGGMGVGYPVGVRGTDAIDSEAWLINGAYMFGNATIKASYSNFDDGGLANLDRDAFAIGLDYALSKRTDVGVLYMRSETDLKGVAVGDSDADVFSAGISHKF